MRITARTPDEYFSLCGDREADMRQLDELIRVTCPSLARSMITTDTMNMVAYGMFTYTNLSGKTQDWPVVALANQKQHISLYICATVDGQYLAVSYADRLGKVSVGKSCIRFRQLQQVDMRVLTDLLRVLEQRVVRSEIVYEL